LTRQPPKAAAPFNPDKMKYLKILAVAIPLPALAFTNPNQSQFGDYLEAHLYQYVSKQTGIPEVLTRMGVKALVPVRKNITDVAERQNYGLFSVHTLPSDFVNLELIGLKDREEIKFLGIGNNFVPLNLRRK
jgi:hypothetical protein